MSGAAVAGFLGAVRRRLWLEAILRQLRMAVWVASSVLVLCAIARLGSVAISFGLASTIALVAGLATLLPALFSRPQLVECALRADRHFDSHALFTTAFEVLESPDPGPAMRVVLSQSARRAAEWRPQLSAIWQRPAGGVFVLAVIPAFFAFLLFQLPQSERDVAMSANESFVARSESGAMNDTPSGTDNLAELQATIARSSVPADIPEQSEATLRERMMTVSEAAPPPPAVGAEQQPAGFSTPGVATASNADAQSPGDARRQDNPTQARTRQSNPGFSTMLQIAIPRRGAASAGKGDGDDAFLAHDTKSAVAQPVVAPVPVPVTSQWTMLTRAEIAYARRYIDATGQAND